MKNEKDVLEEAGGSIWKTPPVSEQPCVYLTRWSVMETQDGARHLVGYNSDNFEGRVSTPIKSFDSVTARVITQSGRIYELVGPPGYDPDADWVWARYASAMKIKWRDVTDEFSQYCPKREA
ncbi:SANTA domain-containing protein [Geomonas ferrireducens]|uniref:hypothetical protein n=1 Tax=Geomonas ferrireducens TaxID=2570227 RepID=UPI0010A85401|nr:hypothetical protein [Geomonas ferrireducens]